MAAQAARGAADSMAAVAVAAGGRRAAGRALQGARRGGLVPLLVGNVPRTLAAASWLRLDGAGAHRRTAPRVGPVGAAGRPMATKLSRNLVDIIRDTFRRTDEQKKELARMYGCGGHRHRAVAAWH